MTIREFTWTDPSTEEVFTYIEIDNGDGSFTSMPKSVYDEQQKAAELGGTL